MSLLNSGGFGCVYYPGIDCNGNKYNDMTKLVSKEDGLIEWNISKKIKKIPHYQKYFSPVESKCIIQDKHLHVTLCSSVHPTSSYMLLKKPYVISNPPDWTRDTILHAYKELLQCIQQLIKHKIVHYDINSNNIIFTPRPILIDFGISFSMTNIKHNLSDCFYRFDPTEYVWPIDVHVLTYIVQIRDLTLDAVHEITLEYVKHHIVLKTYSTTERKQYVDQCIDYYTTFVNLSTDQAIIELLKGWKTWDSYAAALWLFKKMKHVIHDAFHYNPHKRTFTI
jgi:hypothetical protein